MAVGPSLWLCFAFSFIHATITLWGGFRFQSLIAFCQAVNKSDRYPYIKTVLLLLLYVYVPLVVISVTLMWVSYSQDWSVGYFFLVFPFISIVGFIFVTLVTKNDVSNYVDVHRAARSKLPFQPIPPPLVVGVANPQQQQQQQQQRQRFLSDVYANSGAPSPPRTTAISMQPPALPVRDGNVVDDEDAF